MVEGRPLEVAVYSFCYPWRLEHGKGKQRRRLEAARLIILASTRGCCSSGGQNGRFHHEGEDVQWSVQGCRYEEA